MEEFNNLYNPGLKNQVITIPVHPNILIKLIFQSHLNAC